MMWEAEGLCQGDCRVLLAEWPDHSFDACVTDPPYGIGFMGKEWDTFKPGVETTRITENKVATSDNPNVKGRSRGPASSPSAVEYDRTLMGQRAFQQWTESWAREVFRVLKPGAHCVVFGAPRAHHRMMSGLEDAGFEIRDCLAWMFGQGFPKSLNLHGEWEGWGTALKPAFEPIALARKPFKGTLTANVQEWGTGALNIDGCRIDAPDADLTAVQNCRTAQDGHVVTLNIPGHSQATYNAKGRWPAALILDEEAGAMLDAQTGERPSGGSATAADRRTGLYEDGLKTRVIVPRTDTGGASRFFYCPKVSRTEREFGCDLLPGSRNAHPTVKPIALMRWLARLVTPPNGLILDPFVGSGTTGIAAHAEGFEFVGMDQEVEWLTVAAARMQAWREKAA